MYTWLGSINVVSVTCLTGMEQSGCSNSAMWLSWSAERCTTTTKMTPGELGVAAKSAFSAANPPADAPIPTMIGPPVEDGAISIGELVVFSRWASFKLECTVHRCANSGSCFGAHQRKGNSRSGIRVSYLLKWELLLVVPFHSQHRCD